MATILIIEDRPGDRTLLTAILRAKGHWVVEASDGEEALHTLKQMKPDLVFCDVLMPAGDGYELVRRMRQTPALAAIPVIFYTAMYHEREARALAQQCGAVDVVTKLSAPEAILASMDVALGSRRRLPDAPLDRPDTGQDRLRLVSSRPPDRIDRLAAERAWMNAVVEVSEQIAAQRDPLVLLNTLCSEARHMTLAQHAVAGLLTEDGATGDMLYTSGLDVSKAAGLTAPSVDSALLTAVVRGRRPARTRNPDGRPEALGLPSDHPAVSSLLCVPIASPGRVYGWLSLRNKLGTDEFTEADERAAVTVGAHAGIAYENMRLFEDLHRRTTALELELHRTSACAGEEERAELRPPVLDKLGLVAAIEWQAEEFERRSGIRCRVDSRIDQIMLEAPRATAVFKIIQEALANVLQHARATRATVTVGRSGPSLTVLVADNGLGISERDLANGASHGLLGMRERADLLDGRLEVRRRKRSGTVVSLTLPLISRPVPGE
jgi:two-component system cell cycle sensor histidine kinase/response regulator CckA